MSEKPCYNCKEIKPLTDFHKHHNRKDGRRGICKPCRSIRNYESNKDVQRNNLLKKNYGLSLKDYNDMLVNQNYKCAICKRPNTDFSKQLAVDHCHTTGKVRGLLCMNCNNGLGKFMDNEELLLEAIRYLKS